MDNTTLAVTLVRIEQRQHAYEVVARRILDTLEVHTKKLDAILEAATQDPGPSPVAETLQAILAAMHDQTAQLKTLPESLAATIRDMYPSGGHRLAFLNLAGDLRGACTSAVKIGVGCLDGDHHRG